MSQMPIVQERQMPAKMNGISMAVDSARIDPPRGLRSLKRGHGGTVKVI